VPFEIRVVGEKAPVYDYTLEDLGRFNEQPVLPFNAYGTLAVARAEFENNSGSSQVGARAQSRRCTHLRAVRWSRLSRGRAPG
jgi:hypothetical protein